MLTFEESKSNLRDSAFTEDYGQSFIMLGPEHLMKEGQLGSSR